jgi:hypothetical protein
MNEYDPLNTDLDDGEDLKSALSTITQLYTDKTHLVYELLQNAEDCAAKQVHFFLYPHCLELWHDGKPFTQSNITSIRRIAKSDKLNAIGKFGVGFKSVFSICKEVEIYSEPANYGDTNNKEFLSQFANRIVDFRKREKIPYEPLEKPFTTRFVFPFCVSEEYNGYRDIDDLRKELSTKLRILGSDALLFLKNINSIEFHISGIADKTADGHGWYKLQKEKKSDSCFCIKSAEKDADSSRSDSMFLMYTKNEASTGKFVDIVFSIKEWKNDKPVFVRPHEKNKFISVYFPTQAESKLNFIIQAPFATTPNREGVPAIDENTKLTHFAADLLQEAVLDIKQRGWLSLEFLTLLPFLCPASDWLFKPLYDTMIKMFENEAIYPVAGGGYATRNKVRIARGGVREGGIVDIFPNEKLALLLQDDVKWMPAKTDEGNFTDDTKNIFGELYRFIRDEMNVDEIGTDDIPKLIDINPGFMLSPPINNDTWLEKFYNYLAEKTPGLLGKNHDYSTVEFIKTRAGTFVSAYKQDGKVQVPNVYKNQKEAEAGSPDNRVIAGFIQDRCADFVEKMNIKEQDGYDLFIKALENNAGCKPSRNPIAEIERLRLVKKAISFIKMGKPDIAEHCKNKLFLQVVDTEGNVLNEQCGSSEIYHETDDKGVSLKDYFWGAGCGVFILDENYYTGKGIDGNDLRELAKIGVKSSVYLKGEDEWPWPQDNRYKCYNKKPFKRLLDFKDSDAIIQSIRIKYGQDADVIRKKSLSVLSLLVNVEEHLKGQWTKSSEPWVNDTSEIIHKLKDVNWLYNKNGRFVKPSEISCHDLDAALYGVVDSHSNIYDILGFKKTEEDRADETVSEIMKLISSFKENQKSDIFKKLLAIMGMDTLFPAADEFDPTAPTQEPFPSEPIRDLDRLLTKARSDFQNAPIVEYKQVIKWERTSRREKEEKEHAKYRYRGYCQMCEKQNIFSEIAEIFYEPAKEIIQMNLLLCPSCATRYRQLRDSKNTDTMSNFNRTILNMDFNAAQKGSMTVDIGDTHLRFTSTHLAEIQELLRLYNSTSKDCI